MLSTKTLLAAFLRRKPLSSKFDCFRLYDGAGDGLPGLYIDKFGSVLLAHFFSDSEAPTQEVRAQLLAQQALFTEHFGITAGHFKIHYPHSKQRRDQRAEGLTEDENIPLFGIPEKEFQVQEHSVRYLIKPETQCNAGLFLDMREVRENLLYDSRNKSVLNLFCFTGSLGLCAAFGGAKQVVQIDISKSILQWAKANEALNEQRPHGEIKYIADDSILFLQRAARRIERGAEAYDLIIVDPPSFGSAGKRSFSLKNDWATLLSSCIASLKPSGQLMYTCNLSDFSAADMSEQVRTISKRLKREQPKMHKIGPPEVDFTNSGRGAISSRGVLATW